MNIIIPREINPAWYGIHSGGHTNRNPVFYYKKQFLSACNPQLQKNQKVGEHTNIYTQHFVLFLVKNTHDFYASVHSHEKAVIWQLHSKMAKHGTPTSTLSTKEACGHGTNMFRKGFVLIVAKKMMGAEQKHSKDNVSKMWWWRDVWIQTQACKKEWEKVYKQVKQGLKIVNVIIKNTWFLGSVIDYFFVW